MTTILIDEEDPVFAGHYPGFPILPGVFVVEHVHATVRGALPGLRVVALERARFLRPVFPGDELTIETTLIDDGDDVRCTAVVSCALAKVAEIRLRYSAGAP